jgi:DNA polymerase III subunit delta
MAVSPTARKPGVSVYLFHGDEEYELSKAAAAHIQHLCPPENQAFGLETIDGAVETVDAALGALRQTLQALQTMSLFGGTKTVWLRNASLITDKNLAKNETMKSMMGTVTDWIKGPHGGESILVVSAPKINRSTAFFKACKAQGEVREFLGPEKAYQAKDAAQEVVQRQAAERGLRIDGLTAAAFVDRCGTDSRQIDSELAKLDAYLGGERREITGEDVQRLVSPCGESAAWDLTDAMGNRRPDRALRILDRLLQAGQSPVMMIAMIENRLRELLIYREGLDRGWLNVTRRGSYGDAKWVDAPEIVELLDSLQADLRKLHPFRAFKLSEQAALYGRRELLHFLDAALDAHARLTSSSLAPRVVLGQLLLRSAASAEDPEPPR